MSIDLNAIKNKLATLQNSNQREGGTKTTHLWKLTEGQHIVRIVPYQHNRSNPFNELYFHYGFRGKNHLSPASYGQPDPILEFAESLKSTGNRDDWKMGKNLEPKMRCYVPVLVRGKEHEGVKFWGFGKSIYEELLSFIADPDYGDISDLSTGRDIVVESKPPANGKQYGEVSVRIKPNTTPATTDKSVIEHLKNQPDLKEVYKMKTYDELKKELELWLNPEDGVTTSNTTQSTTSNSMNSQPSNLGNTVVTDPNSEFDLPSSNSLKPNLNFENKTEIKDIESAFEDLFGDNK